jgi:hypothetical protein
MHTIDTDDTVLIDPSGMGFMVVLCAMFDSLPSCQRAFIRGAIQGALKDPRIKDPDSVKFLRDFISFDK